MPAYMVRINRISGMTLANGADLAIVHAHTMDDARSIAKSGVKGDVSEHWNAAYVYEILTPSTWSNWRFHIGLAPGLGAQGGWEMDIYAATLDDITAIIASKIVPALVARGLTASWSSPILTFSALADGNGLCKVIFDIYPPSINYADPKPCNGMITEILDQRGTSQGALTVAFDLTTTPPSLYGLGARL